MAKKSKSSADGLPDDSLTSIPVRSAELIVATSESDLIDQEIIHSLEARVCQHLTKLNESFRLYLDSGIPIGACLLKLREHFDHGKWLRYLGGPLQERTGLTERTAQRLMKQARIFEQKLAEVEGKPTKVADLSTAELLEKIDLLHPTGPKKADVSQNGAKGMAQPVATWREYGLPVPIFTLAKQLLSSIDELYSECSLDARIEVRGKVIVHPRALNAVNEAAGTVVINALARQDVEASIAALATRYQKKLVTAAMLFLPAANRSAWTPVLREYPRVLFTERWQIEIQSLSKIIPIAVMGVALIPREHLLPLGQIFGPMADVYAPAQLTKSD